MMGWDCGDCKMGYVFVVNRFDFVYTLGTVTEACADLEAYLRAMWDPGFNEFGRLKDFIFEGFHDKMSFLCENQSVA
ncbi:MAG: hypothetical protein ABUK14_08765, partial [Desulfobacteria bacterium]